MRVSRDQLIFHALSVLEQQRTQCAKGPVPGDCGARLALAVLFSFSQSGDRALYDNFWLNLTAPHHQSTEYLENVCRSAAAHTCMMAIMRDVGAPADPHYAGRVSSEAHRVERKAKGAVPP